MNRSRPHPINHPKHRAALEKLLPESGSEGWIHYRWSNPGERLDMDRAKPALEFAIICGLTRAEICRVTRISRATLYRRLAKDADFRQWFTNLEAAYAESRDVHRWHTHPFRGHRPPATKGKKCPKPRYNLITRLPNGARTRYPIKG